MNWNANHKIDELQAREALLRTFLTMESSLTDAATDSKRAVEKYWQWLRPYGIGANVIDEVLACSTKLRQRQLTVINNWLEAAMYFGRHGLPIPSRPGEIQLTAQFVPQAPGQPVPHPGFETLKAHVAPRAAIVEQELLLGKGYVAGQHRSGLEAFAQANRWYPYEADRWYDFCDTVALMHGYLQLLKKESGCEVSHLGAVRVRSPILSRDADGTAVIDPNDCPRLLFDPRGGMFETSAEFRRKYFMWRCAFVLSLLDVSEKGKLVHCSEHLWHHGQ